MYFLAPLPVGNYVSLGCVLAEMNKIIQKKCHKSAKHQMKV